MKVKKYESKYFSSLYEIEKEAFSDFWSEKGMKDELSLKQANYYVAEDGGEIIGFAGFWLIIDEAEIMKVAVRKSERGKGVGNALLLAIIEDAAMMGAKTILLEVREGNTPARKLYEKHGFISYATREKYYEGKENAVLYKKNL